MLFKQTSKTDKVIHHSENDNVISKQTETQRKPHTKTRRSRRRTLQMIFDV